MRLVLDTNVVISGLLWFGSPRRVFDLVEIGRASLFTSEELLNELEDALNRRKFMRRLGKLGVTPVDVVDEYQAASTCVRPVSVLSGITDKDDECVLECAVAAAAQTIVSGDHHLLDLVTFQGIPIRTPEQVVAIIGGPSPD